MALNPLEVAFQVSVWLEGILYGFLVCLFASCINLTLSLRGADLHRRIMFGCGTMMFVIASVHISINIFRIIQGFIANRDEPGGPSAYLNILPVWHHILLDTLYATQVIFGDTVAIYRTYIIWNRDWRPIVLPCMLLVMSFISGYTVCGMFGTSPIGQTVFSPRLLQWIQTFYAISVVQCGMATGLMAFRLWRVNKQAAPYRRGQGQLMPVLRILVESAALQFAAEIILLGLYLANNPYQFILLECITPTVAITFNAITLRIAMRSQQGLASSNGGGSSQRSQRITEGVTETNQSIAMRHVTVKITRDVEAHQDGTPYLGEGIYDQSGDDFQTKVVIP